MMKIIYKVSCNNGTYGLIKDYRITELARRMLQLHPKWSCRQTRCVLYWQSKSRKQMKERVVEAARILKTNKSANCPEAMGVNVFATALKSGLRLDKTKSIITCRHITLIGWGRK